MSLIKSVRCLLAACCAFAAAGAMAEPGVTDTTIVLGQSAALSGPAAELGKEMRDGAQAYFDFINAQGGVNGRKIELRSLDDGYEPDRAAANTKKLIGEDNVFALFGYVGTPTSLAALQVSNAANVPFFGAFTGADGLRTPHNKLIYNVRASYFDETEAIVEHFSKLGIKSVAVFYQNDSYGKAGLTGVERAMSKRGQKIVATATVERNSTDVAKAVTTIKNANPDMIVMISAYKSCAAFVKGMHGANYYPHFFSVSFVGSRPFAKELGNEGAGVGISQVVPFPWTETIPVVRDYRKIYLKSPDREASFTSLEGFIAAKVFVEGLKRAGKGLTREKLLSSLDTMRDYDAGGFSVSFSPTSHNASSFVELTIVGRDGKFAR